MGFVFEKDLIALKRTLTNRFLMNSLLTYSSFRIFLNYLVWPPKSKSHVMNDISISSFQSYTRNSCHAKLVEAMN